MTAKSLESLVLCAALAAILGQTEERRATIVHVALALLYAVTIWLGLLLYAVLGGFAWGWVLAWSPVILSALVAALLFLDLTGLIVTEGLKAIFRPANDRKADRR